MCIVDHPILFFLRLFYFFLFFCLTFSYFSIFLFLSVNKQQLLRKFVWLYQACFSVEQMLIKSVISFPTRMIGMYIMYTVGIQLIVVTGTESLDSSLSKLKKKKFPKFGLQNLGCSLSACFFLQFSLLIFFKTNSISLFWSVIALLQKRIRKKVYVTTWTHANQ